MNTKLLLLLTFVLALTACNYKSDSYQSLEAERDSLAREKQAMQEEMENYFKTMNLIELNIEKIKNAENVLSTQPYGQETGIDERNKITDDLDYINEMLKANREELDRLRKKLQNSSFRSSELENNLTRLTKALDEETLKVRALEAKITEQDSLINQLSGNIEVLSSNIEVLEEMNLDHKTTIEKQDETIHTAWYVYGTRKELREQNIISSEGWFRPTRVLESDFNKNYFVRIDARKTQSIPLYSSRAKILSSHPKSSYTLEKENNNFTLLITDTETFWSVSKYLVIEVD